MKKIRFVSLLALLVGVMLFTSCKKKQHYFKIRLSNGPIYFKNVKVSGVAFPNVEAGYTSEYVEIPVGSFMVTAELPNGHFLSSEVCIGRKNDRYTVTIDWLPEIHVRKDKN